MKLQQMVVLCDVDLTQRKRMELLEGMTLEDEAELKRAIPGAEAITLHDLMGLVNDGTHNLEQAYMTWVWMEKKEQPNESKN